MKMIDRLESTLLNGYFADGTLLTGLRWPITFLVGTSVKYSCKSILDKSHRCVLAPLFNNIFGSILFFFFFFHCITLEWSVCAPVSVSRAHHRSQRVAPDSSGLAGLSAVSLKLDPGNIPTFPSQSRRMELHGGCFNASFNYPEFLKYAYDVISM